MTLIQQIYDDDQRDGSAVANASLASWITDQRDDNARLAQRFADERLDRATVDNASLAQSITDQRDDNARSVQRFEDERLDRSTVDNASLAQSITDQRDDNARSVQRFEDERLDRSTVDNARLAQSITDQRDDNVRSAQRIDDEQRDLSNRGSLGGQDHHVFPQQFRKWFEEHGFPAIDEHADEHTPSSIDAHTITLTRQEHDLLHNKENWNREWDRWKAANEHATREQIENQAAEMLERALKRTGLVDSYLHDWGEGSGLKEFGRP